MDKIAMLNEILAQNPDDAFARYGLAMEYANRGDVDTALNQFHQLVTVHPDYTAGYQMAGQLLVKAGRIEQAKAQLEAGIASSARSGNSHAGNEMQSLLDEIS